MTVMGYLEQGHSLEKSVKEEILGRLVRLLVHSTADHDLLYVSGVGEMLIRYTGI